MLKVINNFWKFQGLIDGFNEPHRQISSGMVKTTNDSISDMRFLTIPKGDLPHYSYIFMNKETLGMDINNVACSRLGIMLHPGIQKWKEATKAYKFNRILEGLQRSQREK